MKLQEILYSALLVVAVASTSRADQSTGDLIIESRSGGKNSERYGEITGAWRDSNTPVEFAKSEAEGLTPQGQIGSRTVILPKNPGTSSEDLLAAGRFTPGFTTPGRYFVYVTWPKGANAGPVRYVVRHSRGTDSIALTQNGFGYGGRDNANTWILVGEFEFGAGKDYYVELRVFSDARPIDVNTPGRAYADAIRFSTAPLAPSISSKPAATVAPGTTAATPVSTSIRWLSSVAEGLETARREGKQILVFFYSPTSERSMRYEDQVFGHDGVRTLLAERFVTVRVNLQRDADLASRMRAFKSGTINLYDSNGESLGQIAEDVTGEELERRLRTLR